MPKPAPVAPAAFAWLFACLAALAASPAARAETAAPAPSPAPARIIFDTDIGNDVDDALALAVLHDLMDRKECEILAITVCKDNPWAAAYVDLVDRFYGRPEIPIGMVQGGKTPEDGAFIRQVAERAVDGKPVYPRSLDKAPDAVALLRQTLAKQPDYSVVIVGVGFMTNLARLLDSPADNASPMKGAELIKRKVALYCMMAGAFGQDAKAEYNVYTDAPAARAVFERWPTPIIASGYEIGLAITYPASSIQKDFNYAANHPVAEAYRLYDKMPYDRPSWDLTAALYAVRPEHDYFTLSEPGRITLDAENVTHFTPDTTGAHRHLIARPEQIVRTREALVNFASSPPGR